MNKALATSVLGVLVTVAACSGEDPQVEPTCIEACIYPLVCEPLTLVCVLDPSADVAVDEGPDTSESDMGGDEPDIDDLGEEIDADTGDDLAEVREGDVVDASEDTDQGGDLAEEPDLSLDADALEAPDAVTCVELTAHPPEAIIVDWCYEGTDPSGFEITVDGVPLRTLGFGFIRRDEVQGLEPGGHYEIGVAPFLNVGGERLLGDRVTDTLTLPTPTSIVATPLEHMVLSASPAQQEALYVSLDYADDDLVLPLYEAGLRRTSARLAFELVPSDSAIVTVSDGGLVTASQAGQATLTITYSWGDEALVSQIQLTVLETESQGLLRLSLRADSELGSFTAPPTLQLIPRSPVDFAQNVNEVATYPLDAGRYALSFNNFDFGEAGARELVDIPVFVDVRPGRTTAVTRTFVEVDACQTLDSGGGQITASDGAVLTVPADALSEDVRVCLTPLPPTAGAWRGMSDSNPAALPTSYDVDWPSDVVPDAPFELRVPVDKGLSSMMQNQLLGSATTVPTLEYANLATRLGGRARFTVDDDALQDWLSVSVTAPVNLRFSLCPAADDSIGACRFLYTDCSVDHLVEVDEAVGECGGAAQFDGPIGHLTQDVRADVVDLAGSFAAAFGLLDGFNVFPTCVTDVCVGDTCSDACAPSAVSYSCGRGYSARLEQLELTLGWTQVRELEVHVPQTPRCGDRFERCGDDACLPEVVPLCSSACFAGYDR